MPFVPVPQTVQAEFRCTMDGQQVENVLYFYTDNVITPVALDVLATSLISWWEDEIQATQTSNVELREVALRALTTASGLQHTEAPLNPSFGNLIGSPETSGTALAVSLRTGFSGRSFRGRSYFMGIQESDVTASVISVARAEAIRDAYQALLSGGYLPLGWVWVVVSRYSGKLPNGEPAPRAEGLATPITTITITDRNIDSQRRRLPGRGQ